MEYSKEFQELKTRLTYDAKNEMWVDLTVDEIKTILSETHNLMEEIDRLTIANKWVSVSERFPEIGKVVNWSHPSFTRVREGYISESGELKVWGNGYLILDNFKWQPLPELPTPPTGGENEPK